MHASTVRRVTQRGLRKGLGSPRGLSSGGHMERSQRMILDRKRPSADGAKRDGGRTTAYRKRATGMSR